MGSQGLFNVNSINIFFKLISVLLKKEKKKSFELFRKLPQLSDFTIITSFNYNRETHNSAESEDMQPSSS